MFIMVRFGIFCQVTSISLAIFCFPSPDHHAHSKKNRGVMRTRNLVLPLFV
uniref:Candidate secreted effector n=1 Tax=Meloidogyne incognita TaxID=6306 RepID=A0A914L3N8_MELIC